VVLETVGELAQGLRQAPGEQPRVPEDGAALPEDVPAGGRGAGRGEGEVVEAAHRLGGEVGGSGR
jgi:hypothetical protein